MSPVTETVRSVHVEQLDCTKIFAQQQRMLLARGDYNNTPYLTRIRVSQDLADYIQSHGGMPHNGYVEFFLDSFTIDRDGTATLGVHCFVDDSLNTIDGVIVLNDFDVLDDGACGVLTYDVAQLMSNV